MKKSTYELRPYTPNMVSQRDPYESYPDRAIAGARPACRRGLVVP